MEQVRRPEGQDGFTLALGSIRAGKNWMLVLIVLSLLVQLAGFIAVRFGGVIDVPSAAAQLRGRQPLSEAVVAPATRPADAPAATRPAVEIAPGAEEASDWWYLVLLWALPGTRFLAMAMAILLTLTLLMATDVALVGRYGGVAGFVGAFFWSLLLLVVLIPWQLILTGSEYVCGACSGLSGLILHTDALPDDPSGNWFEVVYYYARFNGLPVLALALLLIVQLKFGRGLERFRLSSQGGEAGQAGAKI
jgi:hypothetical protein